MIIHFIFLCFQTSAGVTIATVIAQHHHATWRKMLRTTCWSSGIAWLADVDGDVDACAHVDVGVDVDVKAVLMLKLMVVLGPMLMSIVMLMLMVMLALVLMAQTGHTASPPPCKHHR
jgi:hypothetical protein